MAQTDFDFVIPLFQIRWNTRAVLEGLSLHYRPRSIHIITPESQVALLNSRVEQWDTVPVIVHNEDTFFVDRTGLTKDDICKVLDLGKSLYNPGWFYQQLLKLGAAEGIEGLSEWFVVWDSDLLPVDTWPLIQTDGNKVAHKFALLQHHQYGNPQIVSTWAHWIREVLGVEPLTDQVGTFVPHHMWFKQEHLKCLQHRLQQYYQSSDHWLLLMMRSANEFGTFSEYWLYTSWIATIAPADLAFYPYEAYGETTERFFDDETGLFSANLQETQPSLSLSEGAFSPSYGEISKFIKESYGKDPLPSSLSFESSPRHLKKDEKNMHIEELRSRWNPRTMEAVTASV